MSHPDGFASRPTVIGLLVAVERHHMQMRDMARSRQFITADSRLSWNLIR